MNKAAKGAAGTAIGAPLATRLGRLVLRYRLVVIAATMALAGVAATGLEGLMLASNYRIFFSQQNPDLTAYEELERTFTKTDNVLFVVRARDGDIFSADHLTAVRELTEQAWQIPHSTRVDSLTNFQDMRSQGDTVVVADLVPGDAALTDGARARIRRTALSEVELLNRLVSADGATAGVNVRLQFSDQQRTEIPETAASARRIRDAFQARHPELDVRVAGFAMLSDAFAEAPRQDGRTLMPVMYLGLTVLLAIFLRSPTAAVAALLVTAFASVSAMGIAGHLKAQINPVSGVAPVIIVTLAVADSVHLLTSFLLARRHGLDTDQAVIDALGKNFMPITLTSLTTAVGFLSLNFSDAPPFWHLGNITAVGVVVAWLVSLTFLPAFISFFSFRRAPKPLVPGRWIEAVGRAVSARPRSIAAVVALVALSVAAASTRLDINDKPFEYFDRSQDIRTATEFTIDNLTGVYNISYALGCGSSSCINDPAYLAKVDEFARWLKAKPEIIHVSAVTDVFKRLNQVIHDDDPAHYRLPADRELAAQYLLVYELSLPYGLDINDRIDVDRQMTRLDATFGDVDFKILNRVAVQADAWLAENGLEAMKGAQASSQAIMFSHIAERNIWSMAEGTVLAFVLIGILLAIALRDARLGLVSLMPNLLPAATAMGVWALTVGTVNFAISVVASVSIGIIVDDTVHFLSHYRRGRRLHGLAPDEAVRFAFARVGQALLITSVVIVGGFAVLLFSPFHINVVMGALTGLTIILALVLDFLLLPAVLIWLKA